MRRRRRVARRRIRGRADVVLAARRDAGSGDVEPVRPRSSTRRCRVRRRPRRSRRTPRPRSRRRSPRALRRRADSRAAVVPAHHHQGLGRIGEGPRRVRASCPASSRAAAPAGRRSPPARPTRTATSTGVGAVLVHRLPRCGFTVSPPATWQVRVRTPPRRPPAPPPPDARCPPDEAREESRRTRAASSSPAVAGVALVATGRRRHLVNDQSAKAAGRVGAATASIPANIIDDAVMFDGSTMTSREIQAFLDKEQPRCAPGATCLKSVTVDMPRLTANPMCGAISAASQPDRRAGHRRGRQGVQRQPAGDPGDAPEGADADHRAQAVLVGGDGRR